MEVSPAWQTWLLFCRIRYGYLFFLVLVFLIVFAFSVMMELFFTLFLPDDEDDNLTVASSWLLLAFPLCVFVFGWMFDTMTDLIADCWSSNSCMLRFRLAQISVFIGIAWLFTSEQEESTPITVKTTLDEATKIKLRKSSKLWKYHDPRDYEGRSYARFLPAAKIFSDLLQPFLFDVLVICGFVYNLVYNDYDLELGTIGLIQWGFVVAVVYAVAFLVIEVIVHLTPPLKHLYWHLLEKEIIHETLLQEVQMSEEKMTVMGFNLFKALVPSNCCGNDKVTAIDDSATLRAEFETHKDQKMLFSIPFKNFLSGEETPAECKGKFRRWMIIQLIAMIVFYIVTNIIAASFPITGFILMMTALVMVVFTVEELVHILSTSFRDFIVIFSVMSCLLFSVAIYGGASADDLKGVLEIIPPTVQATSQPDSWESMINTYEVCSVDYYGLHITDLALLAEAAYLVENTTELELTLQEDFSNTYLSNYNVTDISIENYNAFFEIYFPSVDTTVFAVRGTCTGVDALVDMHYWLGIGFLQVLTNYIFPVLNQLPVAFVQHMLWLAGMDNLGAKPSYKTMLEHISLRKDELCESHGADCRILMTGHSLGGGMAALAGATTELPAISFSGPGLMYNAERFDIADEAIEQHVTTVIPENDLVPLVDDNDGTNQDISCPYSSPLYCHKILVTAITLYENCGDPRGRDWSRAMENMEKLFGSTDD